MGNLQQIMNQCINFDRERESARRESQFQEINVPIAERWEKTKITWRFFSFLLELPFTSVKLHQELLDGREKEKNGANKNEAMCYFFKHQDSCIDSFSSMRRDQSWRREERPVPVNFLFQAYRSSCQIHKVWHGRSVITMTSPIFLDVGFSWRTRVILVFHQKNSLWLSALKN